MPQSISQRFLQVRHVSLFFIAIATLSLSHTAWSYPLSEEQLARLQQYLPNTLAKLQRQDPVHIALIGDEVSRATTHDEIDQNVLLSLHGHFLHGLEKEFYYTGGFRLINPIAGNPAKLKDHQGEEFTFEHFTSPAATSLNSLQWLTTSAFTYQPDLILLHFGLNDSLANLSVDTVEKALEQALAICRQNGSEVIIVGPTLMREEKLPTRWGLTRLYANAAKRVAALNRVMFLDPGHALGNTRAAPSRTDAAKNCSYVTDSLSMELFDFGPDVEELQLINASAHQKAGRGMFDQFLNGKEGSDYASEASATQASPDTIKVQVNLTNNGEETRLGTLTPLDIGKTWEPKDEFFAVEIPPGQSQQFNIVYGRQAVESGEQIVSEAPQRGNGPILPVSFFLSDLDKTQLIDLEAPLSPISVVWDLEPRQSRGSSFPLKFRISNPSEKEVTGSYELNYSKQRARGTFQLGPGKAKDFSAQCGLPRDPSVLRSLEAVLLKIECGPNSFVFERNLEAVRNLSLANPVQLSRLDEYTAGTLGPVLRETPSIGLKTKAEPDRIEFTFEIDGTRLESSNGLASVLLDLGLDARPKDEVHQLGFVAPLRFQFFPEREAGVLKQVPQAAFGNGYYKIVDPRFIESSLVPKSNRKDAYTLRVTVPRSFLYRHDWKLGSPMCQIGISADIRFLRANTETGEFGYPLDQTWALNATTAHATDPRSLVTMELRTRQPLGWMVTLR
ncbi:MAG: SGNH/GDSL hydrolase family protein [Verrucomicrobiota bacterium]